MKKIIGLFLTIIFVLSLTGCSETISNKISNLTDESKKLTEFEKLFEDGPLLAKGNNGLWGYIDKEGNWVIEPKYHNKDIEIAYEGDLSYAGNLIADESMPFCDGLAVIKDSSTGKYGFINEKGEWAVEPQFSDYKLFSEDFAAVQDAASEKWGYIDRKGKWIIEPKFKYAKSFSSGLAAVQDDTENVHVEYDVSTYTFSGDRNLWGYINNKGEYVIKPEFGGARTFNGGLAVVSDVYSGKYGYIDESGKEIVPMVLAEATDFSGERAKIRYDGEYAFYNIDKSGNITYDDEDGVNQKINFSDYEISCDIIAMINSDNVLIKSWDTGLYGIADLNGNIKVPARYKKIAEDAGKNGTYAKDDNGTYIIDYDGNILLNLSDKDYKPLNTDCLYGELVRVQKEINGKRKMGCIDFNGNVVIDFQYDFIEEIAGDLSYIQAVYDGKVGFLDKEGNWLIEPLFNVISRIHRWEILSDYR